MSQKLKISFFPVELLNLLLEESYHSRPNGGGVEGDWKR